MTLCRIALLTPTLVACSVVGLVAGCVSAPEPTAAVKYPMTRTVDQIDTYHGTAVADPYRWLENDVREDAEVAAWVEAQNAVTFAYLQGLPQRAWLRDRLETLWDYPKASAPFKEAGTYYVYRNTGLQNHSVLYRVGDDYTRAGADGLTVVLDPNAYSADGTTSLGGYRFSDDGRYLAFAETVAGSDWRTLRVLDLETLQETGDVVPWVKFSSASWTTDSRGFYYSTFPKPEEGEAFQASNLNSTLRYHALGGDGADDPVVHARPDEPTWTIGAGQTNDGRYLIVYYSESGRTNWLGYQPTPDGFTHGETIEPIALFPDWDASYGVIGNVGPTLLIETDRDAPRGRVVAVDVERLVGGATAADVMTTLIPEDPQGGTLRSVSHVGGHLVCTYLRDAHSAVRVFDEAGRHVRDVALPGVGVVSGFGGEPDDPEVFFSYQSLTRPSTIYRYDVATGERTHVRDSAVDVDPAKYVSTQVFYESKDGTRVPMFICHRVGLELDGTNPTLLYGYGGFNVSMLPSFSATRTVWMDLGGVFAMPNLRGGGEYGEAWHVAGTKTDKQNVFDDFITAAEYLIEAGYTSPGKLAIQGGSNGGLLVGACMTQRPELFRAALPAVGVMDMLRYHRFTAGRFWTFDYGTVDDPTEFEALLAYSPVHNLRVGTTYPATLVTTADTDDRVVPGHSFKFAAALQAAHADPGDRPALIRIETSAGHGGGTPTSKAIEQAADSYAFLCDQLGVTTPD